MDNPRQATRWGLADYLNRVFFVSNINVTIDGHSETLRSFWNEHYPELERWFDSPEPMFIWNDGERHLWVKDSWLSQ